MSLQTKAQTETALLVAACAAVGYTLSWIPNVELFSTAVFTCGALRGRRRGALIGALAGLLYFGLNPNGISSPPLYITQVLGMTIVGWGGGLVRELFRQRQWLRLVLACAVSGFVWTLVYDVLTNSGSYLSFRTGSYVAYLLGGLSFPFPLAREIQNSLTFAIATPAILRATERWRLA